MERIFLTSGSSWTVPDDWNDADNSIECIGGGGSGWQGGTPKSGGGGAYAKKNNLALTPGASISYQVGGTAQDTWFKSISDVLAKAGTSATSTTAGVGGVANDCVGDVKYSGGNGKLGGSTVNNGGAGAAGPSGNGADGGNGDNNNFGGNGGNAGNGAGGVGGAGGNYNQDGQNGGNGAEWTTHGSGGGGGGHGYRASGTRYSGNGGLYGGGGGSSWTSSAVPGVGAAGLIVITYEPVASGSSSFFQVF